MERALLSGDALLVLSAALNVRTRYLLDGTGGMEIPARRDSDMHRALSILEHMTSEQIARWLDSGEKMARR
jgi:hypothetical protein